jgi:hypothetical protein
MTSYARTKYKSTALRGGYIELRVYQIKELPLYDFDQPGKNQIIHNVDQILAAKKENPQTDTSKLEAEIDQLVYELYGLSEEEIAIVEGN